MMFARLFAFLLALGAASSAWALDDEQAFIARYRCLVVETLDGIHATPMKTSQDRKRFFVLYWPEDESQYVQCSLFDWDKSAYCEASSGYYDHAAGRPQTLFVVGKHLEALVKLGFSSDGSAGNFKQEMKVDGPDAFATLADLVLSALYEGYSGRSGRTMAVTAPDAPPRVSEERCRPVS